MCPGSTNEILTIGKILPLTVCCSLYARDQSREINEFKSNQSEIWFEVSVLYYN